MRDYEPEIRRAVRIHLHDSPLQRQLDSVDICQSVLANFFVRAAAGQFDLTQPEKVIGLLVTMARNKPTDKARAHKGARRHPGGDAGPEQDNDSGNWRIAMDFTASYQVGDNLLLLTTTGRRVCSTPNPRWP